MREHARREDSGAAGARGGSGEARNNGRANLLVYHLQGTESFVSEFCPFTVSHQWPCLKDLPSRLANVPNQVQHFSSDAGL